MTGKKSRIFKNLLLPLIGAVYPVIFLYSTNVKIVSLTSLKTPLLIVLLLALLLFGLFFWIQKSSLRAGLSALIFLIFFHSYGIFFTLVKKNSIVDVEHFTLLPIFFLVAGYGSFFVGKFKNSLLRPARDILLLLVSGLVIYNVVIAFPIEFQRWKTQAEQKQNVQASTVSASASAPDIYYIIFDEYAGFDALSGYWKYDGYKAFETFLQDKGFFVAPHSHGHTIDTIVEMASRLNFTQYEIPKSSSDLFDKIAKNKVMEILKSYGYSTVVLDGAKLAYPTKTEIDADFNFKYDQAGESSSFSTDEFSVLFYNRTMLRVFSNYYELRDDSTEAFRKMIQYSLEKVTNLDEVPSPKFVYIHVMLPHWPFMYDENGRPIDVKHKFDWNYYLGQHHYATKRAQELITTLLAQANPDRPPVIVFQSDHGARNLVNRGGDGVTLENYPDEYKTNIVNALYLPGYDISTLPDDLDPLETFPIILNFYFDAGIKATR